MAGSDEFCDGIGSIDKKLKRYRARLILNSCIEDSLSGMKNEIFLKRMHWRQFELN